MDKNLNGCFCGFVGDREIIDCNLFGVGWRRAENNNDVIILGEAFGEFGGGESFGIVIIFEKLFSSGDGII